MNTVSCSIVIPHYQNADGLERLLASIPDDRRLETIVVDDYSDDECYAQVLKLKELFNFQLYKNNGRKSAGTCRNIGLEKTTGKWVLFADSDDFFLEALLPQISQYFDSDSEIIFFSPTSIYDKPGELGIRHLFFEKLVINYLHDQNRYFEDLIYGFVSPWSKMYSKDFLSKNKCKFDEIIAVNDVCFSVTAGHKATKIKAVKHPIYCLTMTKGSLINTVSLPHLEARIRTIIKMNAFYKSINRPQRMGSVMYHIYEGRRLGWKATLSLFWLTLKLGGNPFWGWNRWLCTYKQVRQREARQKKFRVIER